MHLPQSLINQPRQLLLVDAAGAAFSMLLMLLVVKPHVQWFGIQEQWAWTSATIAAVLTLAALFCYLLSKRKPWLGLRCMAWGNLGFCTFVVASLALQQVTPTWLGWLFLGSELAIIAGLARLEFQLAKAVRP